MLNIIWLFKIKISYLFKEKFLGKKLNLILEKQLEKNIYKTFRFI